MNKAEESKTEAFYKIYVTDITKRITPKDAIVLMDLYAQQASRDAWKAGRDYGSGKSDKNFNDWKNQQ